MSALIKKRSYLVKAHYPRSCGISSYECQPTQCFEKSKNLRLLVCYYFLKVVDICAIDLVWVMCVTISFLEIPK